MLGGPSPSRRASPGYHTQKRKWSLTDQSAEFRSVCVCVCKKNKNRRLIITWKTQSWKHLYLVLYFLASTFVLILFSVILVSVIALVLNRF